VISFWRSRISHGQDLSLQNLNMSPLRCDFFRIVSLQRSGQGTASARFRLPHLVILGHLSWREAAKQGYKAASADQHCSDNMTSPRIDNGLPGHPHLDRQPQHVATSEDEVVGRIEMTNTDVGDVDAIQQDCVAAIDN